MSCRTNGYNHAFSHIYVERGVREHPRTKQILSRFPEAQVIEIAHYKDVFNRRRQRRPIISSMKVRSRVRILDMIISITARR